MIPDYAPFTEVRDMIVKIVIFSMLALLIFIKFRKELGSFSSHGIYMGGF